MTDILGISAFYHDSAACLVRDGEIIAAAQEERFTRKKHDAGFPRNSIRYCLREGGTSLRDLRYIAFYDKPLVKFERLLETYLTFAPKGLRSFVTAMPVWLKEKLFLKKFLQRELRTLGDGLSEGSLPPLVPPPQLDVSQILDVVALVNRDSGLLDPLVVPGVLAAGARFLAPVAA